MINYAQALQDPFELFVEVQRRYLDVSAQVAEQCAAFHACMHVISEGLEQAPIAQTIVTRIDSARLRRRAREIGVAVAQLAAHATKIHYEYLTIAQHCLLSSHNSLHRFHDVLTVSDPESVESIAVSLGASVAALRQAIMGIDTVIATTTQRALQIKRAAATVAQRTQLI